MRKQHKHALAMTLIILGSYVFIDGLVSFLFYVTTTSQTPLEHIARFIRAGIGVVLVLIGFLQAKKRNKLIEFTINL